MLPKRGPTDVAIDVQPTALDRFVASHVDGCDRPLGIARPRTEKQVEDLVQWANRHRVPLVAVSSPGGPRRRSDTAPNKPSVIVDLSAMDRLIHADGQDGIAVIEPGLTFADFDRKLRPHGLRAFKPLLPRGNKSVLAAYLEREPMTAMRDHWDTSDPLSALSVTFGNGESFRTGTAGVTGTLEENLKQGNRQMMSVGPIASDFTRVMLGSQGSLGIVSWASIYCERIPAREEFLFFGADDYDAVAELARLLALRQLGTHCFILDAVQASAALHGSLDPADGPRWLLYVNISAPEVAAEAGMAWQRADLAELARVAGTVPVTEASGFSAAMLAQRQQSLQPTSYKDAPLGGHREIFCLSQLDRAGNLVDAVEPLLAEGHGAGIIAGIYIQPTIQGASCHLEFTLFHDTASAARARDLERRLAARLAETGGFLSRPYGAWSEIAFGRDPTIVPYLHKMKGMFDPQNLLNPGRLCF